MANPAVDLTRRERVRVALLFGAIAFVTGLAFAASLVVGENAALLGSFCVIAYILGVRHGVDADHIAAIDNTTRKLLQGGKRPIAVGAWFSLGHSTIVVGLIVALVIATRYVVAQVSSLKATGAIVGALVSGGFLWAIGLLNLVIVFEIYRIFQGLRRGAFNEAELEDQLTRRGFLNKFFGRFFQLIEKPWQIYPVGVLFGLGFDTATEIALFGFAVLVASSVPVWMVLVLPLMFTSGMILVDTADGVAMRMAYGWAFLKPIRKVFYNLTITVVSVLVAFAVGTVEFIQVLSTELGLSGGFWGRLGRLDFETLGFGIVGIFVVTWLVAIAVYRFKRYEELVVPADRSRTPPASG